MTHSFIGRAFKEWKFIQINSYLWVCGASQVVLGAKTVLTDFAFQGLTL